MYNIFNTYIFMSDSTEYNYISDKICNFTRICEPKTQHCS